VILKEDAKKKTDGTPIIDRLDGRINQFCSDRLKHYWGTLPPVLYHYTSATAVLNILKTGKLWVQNIEHLNDKSEIRYAASIFRANVERAYALEPVDPVVELFQRIRTSLNTLDTSEVFIASFSADGDEIGMWRLYGDRGRGLSFAIPTYMVKEWGGFPIRCQYQESDADQFCLDALKLVRDCFVAELRAGAKPNPQQYAELFLYRISYFAAMFKQSAWADEKEWRLLFLKPPSEQQALPNGVKYIEIPPNGRVPIVAICQGPLCNYEGAAEPVQRFIRENKLDVTEVQSRYR
jgi:hypothetical protein